MARDGRTIQAYCSGGFPATDTTAAGGQYYFSHTGDTAHGGATTPVAQPVAAGSSTVLRWRGRRPLTTRSASPTRRRRRLLTRPRTSPRSPGPASIERGPVPAASRRRASYGLDASTARRRWRDNTTGAILEGPPPARPATSFTGVLVRPRRRHARPARSYQVQPYKVTAEKRATPTTAR